MAAKPVLLALLLALAVPALAEVNVSIGIGLPNVSIGIRVPVYQDLEPIPGYPAYYAPRLRANYFFYDGMYWVFENDDWYASDWYDGPWYAVDRYEVPVLVLRIPLRYYRSPPREFRRWRADAPPRWNDHWGRQWAQRRHGWERDARRVTYQRPPPPTYQRAYSGARYPGGERQRVERERHYRYAPRESAIRRHYDGPRRQQAPRPATQPPRQHDRPRQDRPHHDGTQHDGPRQGRPEREHAQPVRNQDNRTDARDHGRADGNRHTNRRDDDRDDGRREGRGREGRGKDD